MLSDAIAPPPKKEATERPKRHWFLHSLFLIIGIAVGASTILVSSHLARTTQVAEEPLKPREQKSQPPKVAVVPALDSNNGTKKSPKASEEKKVLPDIHPPKTVATLVANSIASLLGEFGLTDVLKSGRVRVRVEDAVFDFIYIPPGAFVMGCSEDEATRIIGETKNVFFAHNARPPILVNVREGFFILKTEIMTSQYQTLMGAKRKDGKEDKEANELPLRDITWQDAMAFCQRLSDKSGFIVRLPTEIEWEYAARGPWEQRFPWRDVGNFHAVAGGDGPVPFDEKRMDVSWRGVYDMAGNVSEWCLDDYNGEKYKEVTQQPLLHNSSSVTIESALIDLTKYRTYRGGSFKDEKLNCCVFIRRSQSPKTGSPVVGFRPVIVFPPAIAAKP